MKLDCRRNHTNDGIEQHSMRGLWPNEAMNVFARLHRMRPHAEVSDILGRYYSSKIKCREIDQDMAWSLYA